MWEKGLCWLTMWFLEESSLPIQPASGQHPKFQNSGFTCCGSHLKYFFRWGRKIMSWWRIFPWLKPHSHDQFPTLAPYNLQFQTPPTSMSMANILPKNWATEQKSQGWSCGSLMRANGLLAWLRIRKQIQQKNRENVPKSQACNYPVLIVCLFLWWSQIKKTPLKETILSVKGRVTSEGSPQSPWVT